MMLKRYHSNRSALFMFLDSLGIGGAFLFAYWFRFSVPFIKVTKGFPTLESYAALIPLLMLLWLFVFRTFGVYQPTKLLRRTEEVFLVLRAHFVAFIFFLSLTYLFSDYKYSRAVIVFFGLVSAFFLITYRLWLRNLTRRQYQSGKKESRKLVLVGSGNATKMMEELLQRFPENGIRLERKISTLEELKQYIQSERPDHIVFALSREESPELDEYLKLVKKEAIDVDLIPDVSDFITVGCQVEIVHGYPMIRMNSSPLDATAVFLKRALDLFGAFTATLLFSPFFILLPLLIKITSRGPIFYKQERMGLDGKTFMILKFRSMRIDAEDSSGPVWAKKEDQRVTWLGKWMRRTSLDEIPQIFNVWSGEMSMVGPRPERPVFVQKFKDEIPHYMLRHKVKAGITGWAQVQGWRGDTSLEKRVECDLYYIQNWSLWLDLKIVFMTFWRGFVHKNAY